MQPCSCYDGRNETGRRHKWICTDFFLDEFENDDGTRTDFSLDEFENDGEIRIDSFLDESESDGGVLSDGMESRLDDIWNELSPELLND